jgi:type I restriction enzyme S subunit
VNPGDLLVSWSATLGVFEWNEPEVALLNQHIFRVVPNEVRVEKRYLRHGLEGALLEMQRHLHGATMQHVNRGEFLATKLYLPPLAEQRRIAEVLDKAEALRAKRRAALAQLDSLTQSLFLDLFGDPVTNPKGWERVQLGQMVERITKGESPGWQGFDYQADGALFVTSENVRLGAIDLSAPKFIPLEFNRKLFRSELRQGDLLINLVGASIGRSCIFPGYDCPANINQAVAVVTVNFSRLENSFLSGLLTSERGQWLLLNNRVEGARANISLTDLRELNLPLPPLDLQREFARRIAAVEKLKTAQRAALAELDALFASLQHRAFRGEL